MGTAANYKLLLWLPIIHWVSYMHILSVKKIYVLHSWLKDWNYFWNKYYNLPFPAICPSQFPFLVFLATSWHKKSKIALRTSLRKKIYLVKKTYCIKNDYHCKGLKSFIKQPVIKQSPSFASFSILIVCCLFFLIH